MGFLDLFKRRKKNCMGIAFGGGGARGFAHLGAIKAFEEHGITFDYVAGTSVGSIVGALYANGMTAQEMIDIGLNLKTKDIRTSKVFFMPSKTDGIENLIKSAVGDIDISELKKPFTAVSVDIISGQEVHLTKGNLAKACAGSCAIPGFFNYVNFDKYRLLDGGLQNTIPADVLRNQGCNFVVSIDVNPTRGQGTESTKLLDILSASLGIVMKSNAVKGKLFSDVFIEPNTQNFKSTSLDGAEKMIQIGYDAAQKAIPQIKLLMGLEKERKSKKMFARNKNRILKEENKKSIHE